MNFIRKIQGYFVAHPARPESLADFLSRDTAEQRRVYDEALKGAQADQLRVMNG